MLCTDGTLHTQTDAAVQDLPHAGADVEKMQRARGERDRPAVVICRRKRAPVEVHEAADAAVHLPSGHLRARGQIHRMQAHHADAIRHSERARVREGLVGHGQVRAAGDILPVDQKREAVFPVPQSAAELRPAKLVLAAQLILGAVALLRAADERHALVAAHERPCIGVVQSAVNVQTLVEQVVEHNVCALLVIGRACSPGFRQARSARIAPVEQTLALERHEHTADLLLPLPEHTGKARDRAGFRLFIEKAEQDAKLQNIQ